MMSFTEALQNAALEYGLNLNEWQIDALDQYQQMLVEWNKKINLTAITEPEQIAVKHMMDSLSCFDPKFFPAGAKMIDVGTGAGFPGLPLKLYQKDLELTLLDSLNKRVKFLECVKEKLSLNGVRTVHGRAEELAKKTACREAYDLATSRAVARLNVLCEFCLPFVKVGGCFIALKGAQYLAELEEAKQAIFLLGGSVEKIRPIKLPGLEDIRAVIYIKKIKRTPSLYPRKAGTPEKNPL